MNYIIWFILILTIQVLTGSVMNSGESNCNGKGVMSSDCCRNGIQPVSGINKSQIVSNIFAGELQKDRYFPSENRTEKVFYLAAEKGHTSPERNSALRATDEIVNKTGGTLHSRYALGDAS
ncbi:MAG: hypothetical protein WAN36_11965 [Calditrichia bacterium]